jgi:hypothetical protein
MPEQRSSLVAYSVKRAVQDSAGGLFERPDILDFLESEHGAKVFPQFQVSLISPMQGKKLTNTWQGEPDDLRQRLETAADVLRDSLSGFLSSPFIAGARQDKEGARFVGYSLDRSLQADLRQQREQIIAATGRTVLANYKYTPHVTLFETKDQQLAEGLVGALGSFMEVAEIPLELGRTEVVPIANKHIRYQGAN